jgi:hypothetical protein
MAIAEIAAMYGLERADFAPSDFKLAGHYLKDYLQTSGVSEEDRRNVANRIQGRAVYQRAFTFGYPGKEITVVIEKIRPHGLNPDEFIAWTNDNDFGLFRRI